MLKEQCLCKSVELTVFLVMYFELSSALLSMVPNYSLIRELKPILWIMPTVANSNMGKFSFGFSVCVTSLWKKLATVLLGKTAVC